MISSLVLLKKTLLIMDKVSAATKLTVKGTAGAVVDDLVVGTTKAAEFDTEKEKKSVFEIRDGSLKYLLILLVILFTIQYYVPSLIIWILLVGGIILSVEAYHAMIDFFSKESHISDEENLTDDEKIKSAIQTSIILNIEVIVIAMSTVQDFSFVNQVISVSITTIFITYALYAIVLGLVRTDDVGLEMMEKNEIDSFKYKVGNKLVIILPYIMKVLMYIGTYAMALVGGEILVHNIDIIHHFYEGSLYLIPGLLFYPLIGIIVGFIVNLGLNINSFFMKHISI